MPYVQAIANSMQKSIDELVESQEHENVKENNHKIVPPARHMESQYIYEWTDKNHEEYDSDMDVDEDVAPADFNVKPPIIRGNAYKPGRN
jgi:N-methylhydantoinase B/oxoprolinase/acetone carboxylase alpha subunit